MSPSYHNSILKNRAFPSQRYWQSCKGGSGRRGQFFFGNWLQAEDSESADKSYSLWEDAWTEKDSDSPWEKMRVSETWNFMEWAVLLTRGGAAGVTRDESSHLSKPIRRWAAANGDISDGQLSRDYYRQNSNWETCLNHSCSRNA